MILSILIATVVERKEKFNILYSFLQKQLVNNVEILFESDNKEISIGKKRQNLLEKANGKWVVFIDDDDWVSDDYINSIVEALKENPDCVGFYIECSGTKGKTASVSNKWDDWKNNIEGFDYIRTPYQKSPIKKEICLNISYKDMRFGEDYDFSKRLKESNLIKTEVFIPKVLYYYRYSFENFNTKYNIWS
jgi:glycosyltransferase involved in cell wall biosynthesis